MPARPLFLLSSSRPCPARQSKLRPSQARRPLCNSSVLSWMFLLLVVSQSLNSRPKAVNPIRMVNVPLGLALRGSQRRGDEGNGGETEIEGGQRTEHRG